MQQFVELWTYLSATPLFGLTTTLAVYVLAQTVYVRLGQAPLANPVLWSNMTIAALLLLTGTPYPVYFSGAQFIHFLLGPAVVALAVPLWQRREALRAHAVPLLVAATVGGLAAAGSAVLLGWLVGLPPDLLASLAPKSVTAPVAMGISEKIGGVPALAAVFAVLTGLVGTVTAPYLLDAMRIRDTAVRGFAIGTTAHGIGTARAMLVDRNAGAYAALAMGLQVLLGAWLLPLLAQLF